MSEQEDKEKFLELVKKFTVIRGEFTLRSGRSSSYYFDMKRVILSPKGIFLIGKLVLDLIPKEDIDAIGGPPTGGDVITSAVVLISVMEGRPIPGFVISIKPEEPKIRIKGNFPKSGKVAIVEDVITTGGSILKVIKAVETEGCEVAQVIALLDRQQGGPEELRRRGYNFTSILRADASSGEVYINE